MKKIRNLLYVATMLCVCFLFFCTADTVSAEIRNGSCGIGVNWSYDTDTKILVISGNGQMKDWETASDVPWKDYRYSIETVIVENGVTNIGDNAFYSGSKLTNIILPEGLTHIGERAFQGCALKTIDIPDGVEIISEKAFWYCEDLTSVDFPKNLKTIGKEAFSNCESLTAAYIPEGVTSIGEAAFFYCRNLKTVVMPQSVEKIGKRVFAQNTKLESIVLSDALTEIPYFTFSLCESLVSVNIPKNLKSIGEGAFGFCRKLRGVVLPEGLTTIGNQAFWYTALKQIVIPSTVTNVGNECFKECSSLERIAFLNPQTTATYMSSTAFGKVGVTTIYGYTGSYAFDYAYEHGFNFEYLTEDNLWKDEQGVVNPFADVDDTQFFYDSVLWAVQRGITTGYTDTIFAPFDVATRGQMVTFLWRTVGKPAATITDCSFKDVDPTAFYYDAMLWAVENGITTGYNAETFGPHDLCTRAQVVTFLWRVNGKPIVEDAEHYFLDVAEGDFYYDAMLWAVENKITTGKSIVKFAPHDSCSRGEVVTFLKRADNK